MRIAAIWTILLASVGWAADPQLAVPIMDEAALADAGLTLFWEARLPVVSGEALKEAFLRDGSLYVTTERGALFAIQADTGLLRWGDKFTEAAYQIYGPTHVQQADDRGDVVIPTTTRIFIRNRFSGQEVTSFAPDFTISSAAVAYDHSLLLGGTNGRFYSLKVDPRQGGGPIKDWEVATGGPVLSAPILYGPRNRDLLIASRSGAVFSCFAPDKSLHWQFQAGDAIMSDLATDANGVYVPCMDRSLYKLSADTGRLLWRALFPSVLSTPPSVAAQTAFQYCAGQGVTALDAVTGAEKWRHADATAFVAHGPAGDLLFGAAGRLWLVDHEKGDILAEAAVPRVRWALSNSSDEAAYLLADEGRVYCVRLDKAPYLRRQQIMAAKRQLNLPPSDESSGAKPAAPATRPVDRAANDPFRSRHDKPAPANP